METKMNKLPDKPSELIRLAISDLNKAKDDPSVYITMNTWYEQYRNHCLVCLAGSVMKYTLDLDKLGGYDPHFFGEDIAKKLMTLNDFRVGLVHEGCKRLDKETKIYRYPIPYPYMEYNHDKFCERMLSLANLLEAEGN